MVFEDEYIKAMKRQKCWHTNKNMPAATGCWTYFANYCCSCHHL